MPLDPRLPVLLKERLSAAERARTRGLRVLSSSSERILVEVGGNPYLILLPSAYMELTPGRIQRRIKNWPRLKQRDIKGYIILAQKADLSAQAIYADGLNLPPRVAVVGKWGTLSRLAASKIDSNMAYLLELAGIARAEITRTSRRGSVKTSSKRGELESQSRKGVSPEPPIRSLRRGVKVDAYELDLRLGRGQSAEVWRAKVTRPLNGVELVPGTIVAIKIYFSSLLQGFQSLRIQREFSVAADIIHENLARVFDVVLSPSRPFNTFMVMEYIDGPTLKSFIEQRGKLGTGAVLTLGMQLFSALAELHSVGAIHRDVKAANIMLAELPPNSLKIKLVDLGIVSVAADDQFTAPSVFLGSKHSAPMEQLTGGELDARTDIYGAGTVLYHCITGKPMYQGVGPEGAIVRRMLAKPDQLVLEGNPDSSVDRQLAEFVNRCIAVEASDRPTTAHTCVKEIERLSTILGLKIRKSQRSN